MPYVKYPYFYLVSKPINVAMVQTPHDVLGNLIGEVQLTYVSDALKCPPDADVWEVYINDRRITHRSIAPHSEAQLATYNAASYSYFVPDFSNKELWDKLVLEVKADEDHKFCWVISGPSVPQYKLRFKRHSAKAYTNNRHVYVKLDGIPVDKLTVREDNDGDLLLDVEAVEEKTITDSEDGSVVRKMYKKLTIPFVEHNSHTWEEAIRSGDMLHSLSEDGKFYTISAEAADLTFEKPEEDADCSQFVKDLWNKIIPQWQSKIKEIDKDLAMNFLSKLLQDDSYSLTVSGSNAVRGYLEESDIFRIFVQEKNGDLTEYEVAPDLSCHFCNEDGEFQYVPIDKRDRQFIFKVGLMNRRTKECSPVLLVFNKL